MALAARGSHILRDPSARTNRDCAFGLDQRSDLLIMLIPPRRPHARPIVGGWGNPAADLLSTAQIGPCTPPQATIAAILVAADERDHLLWGWSSSAATAQIAAYCEG
jgi:hypothetical protein